jgi:hypothetical protein
MSQKNTPWAYHKAYDDYEEVAWDILQVAEAHYPYLPPDLQALVQRLKQTKQELKDRFDTTPKRPHLVTRN